MKEKIQKAVLVDVIPPDMSNDDASHRLFELESLIKTYKSVEVVKVIQKRNLPDYATYVGKGKLNEIISIAEAEKANLVIVNNILKPRQIFNIKEKLRTINADIWDRVDLILKIFSKHAQSTEAKLQIELASIRHMGPRIYDMGIELGQQRGGTSTRSGQGETNTEMMKRHLRKRELNILKKLEHYELIRAGHRSRRRRKNLSTVALVGYTNAGKTSLLNCLTNKGAYAADALFATLDTRVGKLYVPAKASEDGQYVPGREVLISDTIGFIQDLPPKLIKAFKSTLAETVDADVICHVIDVDDPKIHDKIICVEDILKQLGVDDKPKVYVFNKLDKLIVDNVSLEQVQESIAELQKEMQLAEMSKEEALQLLDKQERERPKSGLVSAGDEALSRLGWLKTGRNRAAIAKITALRAKYEKFHPVFISTYTSQGVDDLKEGLVG